MALVSKCLPTITVKSIFIQFFANLVPIDQILLCQAQIDLWFIDERC